MYYCFVFDVNIEDYTWICIVMYIKRNNFMHIVLFLCNGAIDLNISCSQTDVLVSSDCSLLHYINLLDVLVCLCVSLAVNWARPSCCWYTFWLLNMLYTNALYNWAHPVLIKSLKRILYVCNRSLTVAV